MLHPDKTEKLLVHNDQLKQTIAPHFKLVSVNLDEQNYPKSLKNIARKVPNKLLSTSVNGIRY